MDDSSFQALATHCPGLQHLCNGYQGAEESINHPEEYYCTAITDAALVDLAQKCHQQLRQARFRLDKTVVYALDDAPA